jgi:hypothetical protein
MKGTYYIWLADKPTFLDFTPEDRTLARTKKGSVEATDLDDAFTKSQNGLGENWERFGTRSCSVGDVIEAPDGTFHFVAGMGFETIEKP